MFIFNLIKRVLPDPRMNLIIILFYFERYTVKNMESHESSFDPGLQQQTGLATLASLLKDLDDYQLEDMHEILTRNGLFLPSPKGHWLTKKLLLKVVQG